MPTPEDVLRLLEKYVASRNDLQLICRLAQFLVSTSSIFAALAGRRTAFTCDRRGSRRPRRSCADGAFC
jgi:hypothetical protein